MKTAFAFLLLAASAQAFLPATAPKMPVRAAKAAPTMKFDAKNAAYAIAASPILLSASSALATEGTGEPFGYDNNQLCTWTIQCDAGNVAVLDFVEFSTESNFDFVYFYEADGTESRDRWHGSNPEPTVVSSSSELTLNFNSDGSGECKCATDDCQGRKGKFKRSGSSDHTRHAHGQLAPWAA